MRDLKHEFSIPSAARPNEFDPSIEVVLTTSLSFKTNFISLSYNGIKEKKYQQAIPIKTKGVGLRIFYHLLSFL